MFYWINCELADGRNHKLFISVSSGFGSRLRAEPQELLFLCPNELWLFPFLLKVENRKTETFGGNWGGSDIGRSKHKSLFFRVSRN